MQTYSVYVLDSPLCEKIKTSCFNECQSQSNIFQLVQAKYIWEKLHIFLVTDHVEDNQSIVAFLFS